MISVTDPGVYGPLPDLSPIYTGLSALLVIVLSYVLGLAPALDMCLMDRRMNPYAVGTARLLTADEIFTLTVFFLVILHVLVVVNPQGGTIKDVSLGIVNLRSLVWVMRAVIWYLCTFTVCQSLKYILADHTCSGHKKGNSVSGHFAFYVFELLTLPVLATLHSRSHSTGRHGYEWKLAYLATYFLLMGVSVLNLYRTGAWGYHSIRQIAYGIIAGVLSHYAFVRFALPIGVPVSGSGIQHYSDPTLLFGVSTLLLQLSPLTVDWYPNAMLGIIASMAIAYWAEQTYMYRSRMSKKTAWMDSPR